jgi:hypothetical protein
LIRDLPIRHASPALGRLASVLRQAGAAITKR